MLAPKWVPKSTEYSWIPFLSQWRRYQLLRLTVDLDLGIEKSAATGTAVKERAKIFEHSFKIQYFFPEFQLLKHD